MVNGSAGDHLAGMNLMSFLAGRRFFLFAAVALSVVFVSSTARAQVESYVGKQISAFDVDSVKSRTPEAIASAARAFLKTLDPELRSQATFPLESGERAVWSNLPPNMDYKGLRIVDLSPAQLKALSTLIATSLSPEGFHKTKGIMLGDDLLVDPDEEPGRMLFGADNYWVNIFGTPDAKKPWAWQFDGHHLGLNVALEGERISIAPSFIGTQPADFSWGGTEYHPMRGEARKAYMLVQSLDAEQRELAVLANKRRGLVAGPGDDDADPKLEGIPGSKLSPKQQHLLLSLIGEWTAFLPAAQDAAKMKEIAADISETHFAWFGETADQSPAYYCIHGPSVLIEFSHQNLGGDPMQHLHSVFREPGRDYGR